MLCPCYAVAATDRHLAFQTPRIVGEHQLYPTRLIRPWGAFIVRCRPTVYFGRSALHVTSDGLGPVLGSILPRPGLLRPKLENTGCLGVWLRTHLRVGLFGDLVSD